MDTVVRVNGRGNAWPLVLGVDSRRYAELKVNAEEFANTSFSIFGRRTENGVGQSPKSDRWEILFDIGQGIVPFLVKHGNQLPDAVVLSHGHFDHISGLDWLVSSFVRNASNKRKRFPVYASNACWQIVQTRYPYLVDSIEWRDLVLGQTFTVPETNHSINLTAYPVFHGSTAPGSILLLIETGEPNSVRKAVFTGDVLSPLLRTRDYERLSGANILFADACTRFPAPENAHWSIVEWSDRGEQISNNLEQWLTVQASDGFQSLVTCYNDGQPNLIPFFDELISELRSGEQKLCCSVVEFARRTSPELVNLVHYSGYETGYASESLLTDNELRDWIKHHANVSISEWGIPLPGDIYRF